MKNSADIGECYPPRPSASVDNTLLDLQNSSYPTQPHSIIAKYWKNVLDSHSLCIWNDLLSRCWLNSHREHWFKKKDENDHEKINRQRGRLLHNKEECNMWHEYPQKFFFNGIVVFWQSRIAFELQKRTNLFCFGSFMFTWPVVTKCLFVLFVFVFVFVLLLLLFFSCCCCFFFS